MDPQETSLPLEEEMLNKQPISDNTTDEPADMQPVSQVSYTPKNSKEEVIERLKEIVENNESINKQELEALKQNFYKLLKNEQEAARTAFIEAGGQPEDFMNQHDELEDEYKTIMVKIKEKRQQELQEEEAFKEANLAKKLLLIERLKVLSDGNLDNNAYTEVKEIQQAWKEIQDIPANKTNEVWRNYQLYMEKFYDLLKLNNEFREYDFKKNLEIKKRICEEAEQLSQEQDIIEAFRKLQKLHTEYRETGPVAKELRDELWNRFKAASTEINRKHQSFYEARKEEEMQNLEKKNSICDTVENFDYEKLLTANQWEEQTKIVLDLQAQWKTIGFAPQKMNNKLFERFRSACDNFFNLKSDFFKKLREQQALNLEKKRILCEQAEQLKEDTNWKETTEKFTKLQKDWKAVGTTSYKQSEELWKRFISACDYFFEQRNKANSSQRTQEQENLKKKQDIIAQLATIDPEKPEEDVEKRLRSLIQEWNATGHVPFKDKDKIFKEYRALVDKLFDYLNQSSSQKRLNNFRSTINNAGASLPRERDKLIRAYESKKSEIKTYENNIGFLNCTSKKGNNLVNEMNRKIEKLRGELQLIVEKIKVIDEQEIEA